MKTRPVHNHQASLRRIITAPHEITARYTTEMKVRSTLNSAINSATLKLSLL